MKRPQRIKVFLGGYVNYLNAQNINCRALSEYLDKNRFKVWTILYWDQNVPDFRRVSGVHYMVCHRPVRFLWWMPYLLGILCCDVAYLPKGEHDRFCIRISKLSGCRLFTTLEGVLSGINILKLKHPESYINHFRYFEPNLYSITPYIAQHAHNAYGLNFNSKTLYLGVNSTLFTNNKRVDHSGFHNVVFIGNHIRFKGIEDFLQAAAEFPDLRFHIIGGNHMKTGCLEDYLREHHLYNVSYYGLLDHARMAGVLKSMDLMYFPSRSEGFPKVMLETASAGVPTLCYGDYGADEWITTGKDGFVVNTFAEAKAVIRRLVNNPDLLQELSNNAIELGKRFDWKVLVKDWEEEIERIARM